jgi:hypothetical protein
MVRILSSTASVHYDALLCTNTQSLRAKTDRVLDTLVAARALVGHRTECRRPLPIFDLTRRRSISLDSAQRLFKLFLMSEFMRVGWIFFKFALQIIGLQND